MEEQRNRKLLVVEDEIYFAEADQGDADGARL